MMFFTIKSHQRKGKFMYRYMNKNNFGNEGHHDATELCQGV